MPNLNIDHIVLDTVIVKIFAIKNKKQCKQKTIFSIFVQTPYCIQQQWSQNLLLLSVANFGFIWSKVDFCRKRLLYIYWQRKQCIWKCWCKKFATKLIRNTLIFAVLDSNDDAPRRSLLFAFEGRPHYLTTIVVLTFLQKCQFWLLSPVENCCFSPWESFLMKSKPSISTWHVYIEKNQIIWGM